MPSAPPESSGFQLPAPRHGWLYALPGGQMPERVLCRTDEYVLLEVFKHDFFAATGLYRGPAGLVVLKMNRQTSLHGLSMIAIGRFLARREIQLYSLMQHNPGVPRLIGPVGETGFMHAYVPGHPLGRHEQVGDAFFAQLMNLLGDMHQRHIAYVDLNKRQNVLVGDDGQPYLIDFQISLHLPPTGWRRAWPVRWFLARFQHADRYHCLKHKRRLRPDLMTADENAQVERLSIWIRIHRMFARPLTHLRRRALQRLAKSETVTVAGSSAK